MVMPDASSRGLGAATSHGGFFQVADAQRRDIFGQLVPAEL